MRATPDFDFDLPESARMIREAAGRFADEQITPLAARMDAEDWFPRAELWRAMGELGLHGITVEEEWGGLGLGYLDHVIAVEEVSRASASLGLSRRPARVRSPRHPWAAGSSACSWVRND